jgi:beta-glucosidase
MLISMGNRLRSIPHVSIYSLTKATQLIPFTAPMPGSVPWAAAYSKAVALVSQMTLDEKANITVGYTPDNGCSGVTGSVPRLNWPGLCLSDAGNGLRNTDFVNSWPSGIHVGASWNRNLAYQRALHMGAEFKTKGVHVALGPVVGPLGRVDEGGRNWEGISNDRESNFLAIEHT